MGRSPSFAFTATDIVALFRLGFPMATVRKTLTEPMTVTRRIIMQKARRHTATDRSPLHRAPTACKRVVSGSVSSPNRGSSHLSVALLFAIGCQVVFSLGGWSLRIQPGFHVTGPTRVLIGRRRHFRIRDCHPLWFRFPSDSSSEPFCNSTVMSPTTPPRRSTTV